VGGLANDLLARGAAVDYDERGRLRLRAPAALRPEIEAAVAARLPRVDPLPPPGARGSCDVCGEDLAPHRSGMCWLCVMARRRVVLGARA